MAGLADEIDAKFGKRMIQLKVLFWTNDLTEGSKRGRVRPKHAWAGGVVRMERNDLHGIVPKEPTPFHSLMDLTSQIEKVLIAHGITLHAGRRMQKYFAPATGLRQPIQAVAPSARLI